MLKKRILVISWFYPPVNSSEGLVTYKLLKASQYDYDVFTQKNNALWSYGNKDTLPEAKNVNSIFAKATNLEDWVSEAVEYYKNNVNKYDIVMTRSMPEESHKIGLIIKKFNPKITWIASFGDPIGSNPYVLNMLNTPNPYSITNLKSLFSVKRLVKSFLFKKSQNYNFNTLIKQKNNFETEVIKWADNVILNNKYQQQYMAKHFYNYNQFINKSVIIPHSYDESLYNKIPMKKDKIYFRFIGHLDDIRTPMPLLSALAILKKSDKTIGQLAQFEFYGDLSDSDKLFIINNDLLDLVHIKKPVNYLESLSLMQSSDWLIHIDANISSISENNIFFAAKLADYIGANRNILGITMLSGASADILKNHNKLCVSTCTYEIVNYLYKIIYENYQLSIDPSYEELNSILVAKSFDQLLTSLIKNKGDNNENYNNK